MKKRLSKSEKAVIRQNTIKMNREEWTYQIIINILLLVVLAVCIIPFFYVIGMSFTSEGELLARNNFVIIPREPILAAYKYILFSTNFFNGMKITIIRTFLGVIAALVLTVPVGYIMAKEDLPFRRSFMIFFIITMILNGGLIPNYMLMTKLNLVNKFWVFIVPAFANTYGILVVKLFVEGIPSDLIESAELDGASDMQRLWHIAIPLLKPTICALGLFAAVIHWNDWFQAMVYIKDGSLYPAQYIVRNLLIQGSSTDMMTNVSAAMKMTSQSMKMAGVVVAVLPVLCIYPFLQKYFVHGMYTGSVKG